MEISVYVKIYNFNKEMFTDEELSTIFIKFCSDFFSHMNDNDNKYFRIYLDSNYSPLRGDNDVL